MNHPKIPTPGKQMEAPRSVGGRIQRKPLADCTNTVSRSSQQSSSSVKFANPSLTSSLKRLVEQTTLKEKPKDVNTSATAPEIASRPITTDVRPVTRRMSADLASPASAPSRPQTSRSDMGVSDKDFTEPWSVYTVRRKASGQKRSKDASSSTSAAARIRLDLSSSSGKKTRQASENKKKTLKVAPKKRQRTVKQEKEDPVSAACQDYIEKQKAYFAEIDAFELPVEEVSNSDSD
ncbi:unnamed protein product [Arabidopsis thaliana]|nr:uncharacterized protein AT3G56250 [Arabidopsis thaliana]KAG7628710.1 hypothetical protein ISN45_At03g049230 [Arabidopsis thaliana x Arabidopsis arenosa]ANM64710.1 hypothetical protein AT3G56250 [Arabidopsis thaliana]OAP06193.1 hypothetical protein AXX17_AT3G50890 [Arabidopsis thaliana]CAA0386747.1 unnamed protein product [Arabidopsis thaliana]VYS60568.1 unnamed protein product [Arabidopsis thaliana]|eukprot:NP_001326720.1 hypothetical protein AT3G56250 [Arabidopsis thaliana]